MVLVPPLTGAGLRTLFQPIVDLSSRRVIAFEALTRGPACSPLERPDLLFAHARATGSVGDLDRACQAAALRTALRAASPPERLFINVEPDSGASLPADLGRLYADAGRRMQVVLEVTERALTARPAELLRHVAVMRRLGCLIALDDVGADPRSLAMMAFLSPDVVKLDLRLVQEQPSSGLAEVIAAVNAQAERTGATVLVEGIETEEHARAAVAMGADLGQGWLFGRPGGLPEVAARGRSIPPARMPGAGADTTPFALIERSPRLRASTKPLLFAMSRHLEREAMSLGRTAVLLSAFEDDDYFTPATRRRYSRMAAEIAFCGALARGCSTDPAPGVRGASLAAGDALAREWTVAVVSPHFAGALIARDLGDTGPDHDRRFEYLVTYERDVVVAAAARMMARIAAG